MIFFIVMYSISSLNAQKYQAVATSLHNAFSQYIKENKLENRIRFFLTERGLVISVVDTILFDSGKADLTLQAQQLLDRIAALLQATPNHIRIEGHTDNVPIHNARFPSNWELSSTRATQVLSYFIYHHQFPPSKLSISAYGEYRPIAPNNTSQNRAMNRRVDIVLLRSSLSQLEPQKKFSYQKQLH